jgi:hypothetical protein
MPDGRSIEFTGGGSSPASFSVDEVVTVLYPKDHPEKAVIKSFSEMWLAGAVMQLFGMLFFGDKVSVRLDPLDPKRKYWVNTSSIVPDAAD